MRALYVHLQVWAKNLFVFGKWVLYGGIVGVVVGSVASLFYFCIRWATDVRLASPWLLYLLPLGGVAIALSYHLFNMDADRGTNRVLLAVRSEDSLCLPIAPLIFFGSVVTHLFGGSSGREGAALQLGGSIAAGLGKWVRMDEKDMHLVTMCGMSAAFSALFGTPLTSTLFAMEVISVGVMYYAAIVPCLTASLVGLWIASLWGVPATHYTLMGLVALEPVSILQVIVIGLCCALVSALFCIGMHQCTTLYAKYCPNPLCRAAVGGMLVVLLTLLVGSQDYNGTGSAVITQALAGQARPEAFFCKMVFTALTLGAGYKGGEIVPAFFIGATLGHLIATWIGLPPALGAALGLVGLFCGVTNCPITSFLLALELFGGTGLVFFAIICAVTYMLSGYYGLYSGQKILYSKLRPEFINRKTE